jgi:hypothetical protein
MYRKVYQNHCSEVGLVELRWNNWHVSYMFPVFCIRLEGFVTDIIDMLDTVHHLRLKIPQLLENGSVVGPVERVSL